MKNLPKISVIVPSFNKVKYIEATLRSIVVQNYPNLEVIIQDGGSTDGTVEIIKKYSARYPKVINWESKKDNGQLDAINKGLKKSQGKILSYINADDVYKKGALLKVGNYFSGHPRTLWLAGKGDVIDENGKIIASVVTKYKNYLLQVNSYQLLLVVNYLMQPSVFLSKKAYERFGPFTGTKTSVITAFKKTPGFQSGDELNADMSTSFRGNHARKSGEVVMEYDLWLKMGRKHMPAILKSFLSGFRISRDSISASFFKKTLKEDEKIAEKYTTNPALLMLHYLHNIGRVLFIKLIQ